MISGLQQYPVYKDSGLPWLHSVPSHWKVRRAKEVFRCIDVRSTTGNEELLTVSAEHGVIPRRLATVTMFKAESYVGYKLCWPGDLVINSLWAWGRGLGVSRHHGIVSSAYGVYRLLPEVEAYSGFVHELVRSVPFNWELQVRSKGIWISRLQLTDEAFLEAPIPLPPTDEQAAIVRFLDHADRQIRRYIGVKKKLIALLSEQKQQTIQEGVARGLNPRAPLKPSGVQWLGEVPRHWEVWQVGHFGRVGNGSTPSRGQSAYWSGGSYPWLNSSSVNRSPISGSDQFVTDLALRECHLPRVPPSSVLVAITGQGKTRGTAAVLAIEATINQHIAYITPRPDIVSAEYLQLLFVGAYRELRSISDDSGSTKGALTCADVAHFKVALPALEEQEKIIGAVRLSTHRLDAALVRSQREIELLIEYRARLIADVVTGQIDVREAAAGLSDAAAPSEDEGHLADEAAESDDDELDDAEAEVTA